MKFVRYGKDNQAKPLPGLVDHLGNIRNISQLVTDLNSDLLIAMNKISETNIDSLPIAGTLDTLHIFPCVPNPSKLIGIAFNSKGHTKQMGETLHHEPIFFFKAVSAICGATDPIIYPKIGKKVDWEAELGVVIGKGGKYIPKEQALEHVLGYCCAHDISDRGWQLDHPGRQHTKGKSFDTFAPIGPYLVTKDEIENPNDLRITLKVNGEMRQDFSTKDYSFTVEEIISFLSQFFTLVSGDVIFMGSGPGTACMWNNKFLAIGDKVELEIHQLGKQVQVVVAEK